MDHDVSGVFVVEIFRNEQQVWKVWLVDNQSNWINANNGTELNNRMWKSKRMLLRQRRNGPQNSGKSQHLISRL